MVKQLRDELSALSKTKPGGVSELCKLYDKFRFSLKKRYRLKAGKVHAARLYVLQRRLKRSHEVWHYCTYCKVLDHTHRRVYRHEKSNCVWISKLVPKVSVNGPTHAFELLMSKFQKLLPNLVEQDKQRLYPFNDRNKSCIKRVGSRTGRAKPALVENVSNVQFDLHYASKKNDGLENDDFGKELCFDEDGLKEHEMASTINCTNASVLSEKDDGLKKDNCCFIFDKCMKCPPGKCKSQKECSLCPKARKLYMVSRKEQKNTRSYLDKLCKWVGVFISALVSARGVDEREKYRRHQLNYLIILRYKRRYDTAFSQRIASLIIDLTEKGSWDNFVLTYQFVFK